MGGKLGWLYPIPQSHSKLSSSRKGKELQLFYSRTKGDLNQGNDIKDVSLEKIRKREFRNYSGFMIPYDRSIGRRLVVVLKPNNIHTARNPPSPSELPRFKQTGLKVKLYELLNNSQMHNINCWLVGGDYGRPRATLPGEKAPTSGAIIKKAFPQIATLLHLDSNDMRTSSRDYHSRQVGS